MRKAGKSFLGEFRSNLRFPRSGGLENVKEVN